jgi:hypothetical protein
MDGCWYQSPWDYRIDEHANTWHAGLGSADLFGLSWLSGEVRYHDLGEYNIFSAWSPSDHNFDARQKDGCRGDCPKTKYGYGHADVKALSLSLLPEYRFSDFAFYARLGIARISAKYEVLYSNSRHDTAKGFKSYEPGGHMMWEPQYGVGFRWKDFSAEYTEISPMKPEDSCIAKSRTITLNYRWWFKGAA